MPESIARTAQRFFNPNTLAPFLIGSVALGVLSNAAFTLLTNLFGTGSSSVAAIGIGSLLILASAVLFVSRMLRSSTGLTALPGKRPPAKHRGLILLVSNLPVCKKAIEFHGQSLERVWLICSTRSLGIAKELQGQFPSLFEGDPLVVDDVHDPSEFYAKTDRIYGKLPDGWTSEQVIADFTGMTASASIGVVLSCLPRSRPLQYTPAEYNEALKANVPLDPIEITFDGLK